jgi:hypothetical protein
MVFNTRKRKKSRLNSTQKKQKGGSIEWFEKMLKDAKAQCFTEKKKNRDRDNSWFYTTKKLFKKKAKIEAANHFHVFTNNTAKFPHGSNTKITIVNPSIITNSQLITAITCLTHYLSDSVRDKSADQGLRAILKFYCGINPSDEISNELTQAKENAKLTINDNTNDVPCKTPPIITSRAPVTMSTPVSSERNVSKVDDAVKIFKMMDPSNGLVDGQGRGGSANFIIQGRDLLVNIFKNYDPNCYKDKQKNQEKQLCTDGQSFFKKLNNCPNFSTNPEDYISFVENIKKSPKGEFIKRNTFKGVTTTVTSTESVEALAKKQKRIKFATLKKFIKNQEYYNDEFDVDDLKLGVDVDLKNLKDILGVIETFQVTGKILDLIQKTIDLINKEEKNYKDNFLVWTKKKWEAYFYIDSEDSSNDSSNDSDDDDICESERKKSDEEERYCKIIELRDLLIHILDDETVKEGMIAIRGSFSRGGGTRKRGKRKKIKRRVKTRRKRQRKQINTRKKRGRKYTRKY